MRSLKWVGSSLYRCGRRGADLRSASAVIRRTGGTRRTYRCRVGMHITINAAEVDEYVTARVCALLDKHGAGLLPGRDHEAINDLHAEANTLRARLDELADMLGDGEVTRQQYARQRERIEGKLDPDEQSPPPSSMSGEGREGHAGFKGFAIMAHRRLVSAVGGLAATDNMYRRITEQAKDLLRMIAAQAANAP